MMDSTAVDTGKEPGDYVLELKQEKSIGSIFYVLRFFERGKGYIFALEFSIVTDDSINDRLDMISHFYKSMSKVYGGEHWETSMSGILNDLMGELKKELKKKQDEK